MMPQGALLELLERLGASRDGMTVVSEKELSHWPEAQVKVLKLRKLVVRSSPATTVVCQGCEQLCTMPVDTVIAEIGNAASFVVCDKRDDISRVPISGEHLRQWGTSLSALATLVADLLGCIPTDVTVASSGRREVGLLKGRKHSSHIVLVANGGLNLLVAGHTVPLADVLTLEGASLRLDRQTLVRLVDRPVAGAGDIESAAKRRERLTRLVREEKAKGTVAFLKTVAAIEAISVSRLKQLLLKPTGNAKSNR